MEEKLKVIIGLFIKKTKSQQIKWSQINENSNCVNFNENKIAISNQMVFQGEEKNYPTHSQFQSGGDIHFR